MNSPDPVSPPSSAAPSGSTVASGVGGSIVAIAIYLLSLKGITIPPGLEALLGALGAALSGYLPKSGRITTLKILALCLVMPLTGCATIAKVLTPTAQPFVQAAVDVAVATAVQKGISAAQIKSIAGQVLAADTGTQVALNAIEEIVNGKIVALHLPPADLAASQVLTATLEGVIQLELSGTAATAITAQTQVAVADLMNDVIIATAAYGQ